MRSGSDQGKQMCIKPEYCSGRVAVPALKIIPLADALKDIHKYPIRKTKNHYCQHSKSSFFFFKFS